MLTLLTISLIGIILQPIETTYQTEKVYHSAHQESVLCSCVDFVRQLRPDLPSMDASDFVVATTTPTKGAIAKMYYPNSGLFHLAYVEEVGDGWVMLRDSNYRPCEETVRTVTLPDRISGYL